MTELILVGVLAYWLGFATAACLAARRDGNDHGN